MCKKTAAIVTLFDNWNIGNKLQNYALQTLLREYFFEVTTLTYCEARENHPLIGWKGRMVLLLGFPREKAAEKKAVMNRYNKFRLFSEKYISASKPKHFKEYDENTNAQYDYFIVGSDQVWHNFSNTDEEIKYFMLDFAEYEKRVCFSPSFGFNKIPDRFIERYITGLSGFEYLSCREQNGCQMIKELLGKDAQLLPDPTMCVDTSQWISVESKPDYSVPERFILVYILGEKDDEIKNTIDELSRKLQLPVIDVLDLANTRYYCTSPDEFIYLIRRAEYMCTNSFHGSVFSIMFHVKLKLLIRKDKDGSQMNARFETLFAEFKVKKDKDDLVKYYDHVDEIFVKKREVAREYLEKVFHIDGINL